MLPEHNPAIEPTPETPNGQPSDQFASTRRGAKDHRLFFLGISIVVGLCVYFASKGNFQDITHLYEGIAILILAFFPSLMWAYRGDNSFPLFEAFLLTNVNTYAIPLLTGHQSLYLYSDDVISRTGIVVIAYQISCILVYNLTKVGPSRSDFWVQEIISEEYSRFLSYGMIASTAYAFITTFYGELFFSYLPRESEGITRASFFGLGIICTFITCRRWGLGQIKPFEQVTFLINLILQFLILSSTLYLVGGISLIVLALLGFISGSRRIPILAIVIIVPIVAVLHEGKSSMREKYWGENRQGDIQLSNIVKVYNEWFEYGLTSDPDAKRNTSAKLLERTSLYHILCLVVAQTPERQDYLYGETYKYIPGQFIPRFFWPNKPVAHISTYRLSIYYGLQNEEDTRTTTIGFGMLSEAYANFGLVGTIIIGAFLSAGLKIFTVWARRSPMLSNGGLLLVVLMAWSFQTELTLSIWVTSLFQACVAVIGIPLIVRSFFS